MPDLGTYLQKALEAEAGGQIDKAIQKGLDKLFKRNKKKRKKKDG